MKRRRGGFTWIEVLAIFIVLTVLAAILLPALKRLPRPHNARCSSNLKQIGIALMQYAEEYDERLPPAKFKNAQPVGTITSKGYQPYGWADAAVIYSKSTQLFQCPVEPQTDAGSDPTKSGYTDYWFNSNLSTMKLQHIAEPSRTLMLGDGNDGTELTDARYSLNALPQAWRESTESPAQRHRGTANYTFADGHVKALKPQAISNLPTRQSKSTFSVR